MKVIFVITSVLFILFGFYWTSYLFSVEKIELAFTDWFNIYIYLVYSYCLLLTLMLIIKLICMYFGLRASHKTMKIGIILIIFGVFAFVSTYVIAFVKMGNNPGWID